MRKALLLVLTAWVSYGQEQSNDRKTKRFHCFGAARFQRKHRIRSYAVILVNNQLDALFSMYLFHFCTCFEQPSAHHQENQFYQCLIWYISLCVGDCLVCRSGGTGIPDSHLHRVIYTRWCIDKIDSPDDEHWVVRNMYRNEINTLKKARRVGY